MRLCTANNFRVTEKLQNCAMDTGRGNDLLHRSGYAISPWHPQQVLEPQRRRLRITRSSVLVESTPLWHEAHGYRVRQKVPPKDF